MRSIGEASTARGARPAHQFIRSVHQELIVREEDPEIGRDSAARTRATGEGAEEQANGTSTPPSEAAPPASAVEVAPDMQRLLDEQRDRYLRLAAEFDNFRKRTAREREEAGARAQGELVRRLMDSLDDMGRAASVNTEGVDARAIIEGVQAVAQKLGRALADAGLEVINPIDQPFNPELHEALATEPALSREDDHLVSQVYQPGYVFQGQLLRPARVVVRQWQG